MRAPPGAGNVVGAMTHQYTLPKVTEIARSMGVSRRTLYHWIDSGQLEQAAQLSEQALSKMNAIDPNAV